MKRWLPAGRPSPAMVVAFIALCVGVTGGAFAAATIDSSDIVNGSITKKDLHKNSVNTKKVKNKTLKAVDFAPGQLAQGVQGIPGLKGEKGEKGDTKGDDGDTGAARSQRPLLRVEDGRFLPPPRHSLRGCSSRELPRGSQGIADSPSEGTSSGANVRHLRARPNQNRHRASTAQSSTAGEGTPITPSLGSDLPQRTTTSFAELRRVAGSATGGRQLRAAGRNDSPAVV